MAKATPSLLERYQEDLKEAKKRSSGSGSYLQLEDGTNRVRPLPHPDFANEPFYVKMGQHYGLGPENKSVVYCPRIVINEREDCPICDFIEAVRKKSKDKRELEVAKRMFAGVRYLSQALNHSTDRKSTQVLFWSYGPMIQRSILSMLVGDEYRELVDLRRGYDLMIEKEGRGRETKYQVYTAKDSSSVPEEVMEDVIDLKKYIDDRLLSADDLQRVLDGDDPNDLIKDRDRDDDPDDEPEPRASARDDDRRSSRDDDRRSARDDEPRARSRDDDRRPSTREDDRRPARDDDRPRRSRDDEDAPRARSRDDDDDRRPSRDDEPDDDAGRELARLRDSRRNGPAPSDRRRR